MNTYMIFVKEQQRMNPQWRNKSNAELVSLCSPMWKALSPEEKQIYEEMKRNYDSTDQSDQQRKKGEVRDGGYDTHGRSLKEIKRRDEEMKEAEQKKVEKIHSLVAGAMTGNKLANKVFFLIEVNTFCDDIPALAEENLPPHKQTKKETIPAEISICKFSLEDGVKDEQIKHFFIKPGKFSRGFSFIVKKEIMATHKIDSEQEDDFYLDYKPQAIGKEAAAKRHYETILRSILKFLDPSMNDTDLGVGSPNKPILFTMPGSVSRCEKSLLWLYQKLNKNVEVEDIPMAILELPQLFHELAYASVSAQLSQLSSDEEKRVMMRKVIPASVAEDYLEKDSFKYVEGMSCSWHKDNDTVMDGCGGSDRCTTTQVRRWGFIMADHLCQKFHIQLIKGQHVPQESDELPPYAGSDQDWESLPGLAIRPPVAPKGRSENTDIRYRNGEVLHSTNTISDFLDEDMSSTVTSLDHYNGSVASVASGVMDSGDAKPGPVEKKLTQRPTGPSKERVFKQNVLMAGLLGNRKKENDSPPKESTRF